MAGQDSATGGQDVAKATPPQSTQRDNTEANTRRESIDRQNVNLDPETTATEGVSSMAHRKRNGKAAEGLDPADEAVPILSSSASAKDYQSISPTINAKSTSADPQHRQDGAVDQAERARSNQLREERDAQRAAAEVERGEGRRWRKWLDKYGSVELENKGSVARDHLALERTFLAWLRTSLSFASIGIAVTQLFRLNTSISSSDPSLNSSAAQLRHVGKPLGATFIAISIVILFIGFHRYFEAQHYVIRGKFPASRGSVLFVTLVAGALIVSSLVVILAVAPRAFEK
ncbi:hypothetical protein BDV96DRAFT_561745 [Lophiotrema nucula]|uniref:DUF202 domain-containing protein n=1 Tax=Lophiotrema nucula TaxID=690887 RepID=A0A6A5ZVP4_9PLEO|nr:hypothetical protein BDV96DRAFT_561745 [Lophiotrema nucula]